MTALYNWKTKNIFSIVKVLKVPQKKNPNIISYLRISFWIFFNHSESKRIILEKFTHLWAGTFLQWWYHSVPNSFNWIEVCLEVSIPVCSPHHTQPALLCAPVLLIGELQFTLDPLWSVTARSYWNLLFIGHIIGFRRLEKEGMWRKRNPFHHEKQKRTWNFPVGPKDLENRSMW